jgi:hypothetical protein
MLAREKGRVRERKREREIEKYCGRYHYYSNQQ